MVNEKDIFWKDGDFGECVGGFYIKNNLKQKLCFWITCWYKTSSGF
jgi:hypothetical protein